MAAAKDQQPQAARCYYLVNYELSVAAAEGQQPQAALCYVAGPVEA